MMIFFTLVFLIWSLITLFKGNLFVDDLIKSEELELQKYDDGVTDRDKEKIQMQQGKVLLKAIIVAIPLAIVEIIYLITALSIDIYLYPTVIAIVYLVLTVVKSNISKKPDLNTEDGRLQFKKKMYSRKRYTFKGALSSLIWSGYWIYMFYILVFLNR